MYVFEPFFTIRSQFNAFSIHSKQILFLLPHPTAKQILTLTGGQIYTVEAGAVWADPGYSANDAFEGNVTSSVTITGFVNTQALSGTVFLLQYAARDTSGNTARTSRNVTVLDRIAPFVTLNGAASLNTEAGQPYTDDYITFNDSAVTRPPTVTISGLPVDTSFLGRRNITFFVADSGGNVANVTRVVNVVDTTPPAVTLNGAAAVNVEYGMFFTDPGATAFDYISRNVTGNITASRPANLLSGLIGQYVVTYSASDSSGNIGRAERTVVIRDTQPPTITLVGGFIIEWPAGQNFTDPGYSAVDSGICVCVCVCVCVCK